MTVESPLELYTLLYAWKQYNNFWNVLAGTGLVFLPFVWLLGENVLQAAKGAETSAEAAVSARRPVLVDMGLALLVLAFAGAPLTTIQPGVLAYQNPCQAQARGTVGATATTYDAAFNPLIGPIEVPAWWRLVLALSYGINRAALAGIGCVEDIALVRQSVDEARVTDPVLAHELRRFRQECFYPARSTLQATLPSLTAAQRQRLDELLTEYGRHDPEWEGSQIYRTPLDDSLPPLYDLLTAAEMQPVAGFPFDLSRESDIRYGEALLAAAGAREDNPVTLPEPAWGIPTCHQWWVGTDAANGLRTRLLAVFGPDLIDRAFAFTTGKERRQMEDEILMSLMRTEIGVPTGGAFGGSSYTSALGDKAGRDLFANLGILWEGLSVAPMLHAVKAALPMVKALLLMGTIMLIPFVLLGAAYRLEAVFLITVGLCAINFLSVLWGIAWALEQALILTLWPDATDYIGQAKYALSALSQSDYALKVRVLQFLLPFLYLFLPLVFFMVIGWAGIRALSGIGGITGLLTNAVGKGGRVAADSAKNSSVSVVSRQINR